MANVSTVHEQLVNAVRLAILDGEYSPGFRLRQVAVAEQFGVSPVPVREALRALEQEGLVDYNPRRGWMVAILDEDEIREIYELRSLLEQKALREAIPNLTEDDAVELAQANEAVVAAESASEHLRLREQFYTRLYGASGKKRLVSVILNLHNQLTPYLRLRRLSHSNDAHTQLLDAVHAKDADRACRIMAQHLAEVEEHCVRAFRSLNVGDDPAAGAGSSLQPVDARMNAE